MAFKHSILVVANRTADSDELSGALLARAEEGPVAYTLVVPPTAAGPDSRAAAEGKLAAALGRLRDAGLEIGGGPRPPHPLDAGHNVWEPRRLDEGGVATPPRPAPQTMLMDRPPR